MISKIVIVIKLLIYMYLFFIEQLA